MKKLMLPLGFIFLTVNPAIVISCGQAPSEIIEKYNVNKLNVEFLEEQNKYDIESKILLEAKKIASDAVISDFLILIDQNNQLMELDSNYISKKDDVVIIMPSYTTKIFMGIKEVRVIEKKDERIDISTFKGEDIYPRITPYTTYNEIQNLTLDYLSNNLTQFLPDDILIYVNNILIDTNTFEYELVDKDIIRIVANPNSKNIKGEIIYTFNFEKIIIPNSAVLSISIMVGDEMQKIKENIELVLINYLIMNNNIETKIKYSYDWSFEAIVRNDKPLDVSEYDGYVAQKNDLIFIKSVSNSKIIMIIGSIKLEVQ